MILTFVSLVAAALLEVGGDAAIRNGLVRPSAAFMVLGAGALAAYGLAVNVNRALDFGRLMGLYIAVFFVVSQLVAAAFFAERPSPGLVAGGLLIVAGGLVIQATAR